MEQRPKSTLGLLSHLVKLRLAGIGHTQRVLLFATVLAVAIAGAIFARCLFPACPTGCPTGVSSAAAESPCSR